MIADLLRNQYRYSPIQIYPCHRVATFQALVVGLVPKGSLDLWKIDDEINAYLDCRRLL